MLYGDVMLMATYWSQSQVTSVLQSWVAVWWCYAPLPRVGISHKLTTKRTVEKKHSFLQQVDSLPHLPNFSINKIKRRSVYMNFKRGRKTQLIYSPGLIPSLMYMGSLLRYSWHSPMSASLTTKSAHVRTEHRGPKACLWWPAPACTTML